MTWLFVFEMTWCSLYSRVFRIDYMHTVYVYECIWLCHCANTPLFSALFISLPVHAHMKSCTNGQVVMFMPSHFPFFSPFSSPLVLPPPSSAGPGPTPSTDDSCLSPRPANSCGSCGPAGLPNAPWLQLQAWLQWVASVHAHTRCTFMNRCNFQSSFYVWCFTCFSPSKQGRVLPFSHTRSLVVSQKTSSPL